MDLRILNVDDDMINRKLLSTMIKKAEGVSEVVEVANGEEALKKLKSEHFDIVLLDIIMPILDGLEVIRVMKSDKNLKDIPIIILTTDETKKAQALELGANDFLPKPVRTGPLIEKIQNWTNI
ncbi:MAG: response regulator [Campylobacterota bacterium]